MELRVFGGLLRFTRVWVEREGFTGKSMLWQWFCSDSTDFTGFVGHVAAEFVCMIGLPEECRSFVTAQLREFLGKASRYPADPHNAQNIFLLQVCLIWYGIKSTHWLQYGGCMGLIYENSENNSVIGDINWAMSTTGTRIAGGVDGFFPQNSNVIIKFKGNDVDCRISLDSKRRTISWGKKSVIAKTLRDKFGAEKTAYREKSVGCNILIEKIKNKYQLKFIFSGGADSVGNSTVFCPNPDEDKVKRIFAIINERKGQSEFRSKLLHAYNNKCAVTGCDAVDALEAAHIYPYRGEQTNHITNGLLLRADIHSLFDQLLLSISNNYEIILHDSIRNGYYGELHDSFISLPEDKNSHPSKEALRHNRSLIRISKSDD